MWLKPLAVPPTKISYSFCGQTPLFLFWPLGRKVFYYNHALKKKCEGSSPRLPPTYALLSGCSTSFIAFRCSFHPFSSSVQQLGVFRSCCFRIPFLSTCVCVLMLIVLRVNCFSEMELLGLVIRVYRLIMQVCTCLGSFSGFGRT